MSATLRSFELPPREYAFVQEVESRLGALAKAWTQCVLTRSIKNLSGMPADQEKYITDLAARRGITLPV